MADVLKKIRTRAKQIQKNSNVSYRTALKKAGKEHRTGKSISGVPKKKPTVKKRLNDRVQNAGLTIAAARHFMKSELENRLGREEVKLFNATNKTQKKPIRKRIAEIKSDLRKLKK